MDARRRKFAKLIVDGMNQTKAAIAAGYSEKTARQSACRAMASPQVKEAIAREKARRNQKTVELVKEMSTEEPTKKELADPLQFFSNMMENKNEDPDLRLKAAQQLAAYTVPKPAPKKATKAEERQKAAENSFFSTALKAVK